MSTLQASQIKNASSATTNLALDTAGNATVGNALIMGSGSFLRNRIINGEMRIDQRNAGASGTGNDNFIVDRWKYNGSQASKLTWQQNAGSVTPPPGHTNYLGVTSSSSYSMTGNDYFNIFQIIEGYNVADLAWGTANAKAATLSFWVYSSLTGTFGGSIATTKTAIWVMPFIYSIPVANTWTYITVPITAATATGGANTDNSAGVFVRLSLGAIGTSVGGTAGVWTSAGNYTAPAGIQSVVGTNGATWYITGVQLEAGSTATPFERRQYGHELVLCQRYFFAETSSSESDIIYSYGSMNLHYFFPVTMRAVPTISVTSGTATINRGRKSSVTFNPYTGDIPFTASAEL